MLMQKINLNCAVKVEVLVLHLNTVMQAKTQKNDGFSMPATRL